MCLRSAAKARLELNRVTWLHFQMREPAPKADFPVAPNLDTEFMRRTTYGNEIINEE